MAKLKLKIHVNPLQLLCIVVSVALHGEFERFCGFALIVPVRYKKDSNSRRKLTKIATTIINEKLLLCRLIY